MSVSSPQPHPFVRPGQVAAHLPPPDQCMACGQPAAAHSSGTYTEEAAAQDAFLDRRLAIVRKQQVDGDITVREAADLRVRALEHHLAAVVALRNEHFGGSSE